MVNIHITGDRDFFKSKNSINKFKTELRELKDPFLIDKKKFLKDGYEFEFKDEGEDIYVNIKKEHFVWGDNRTADQFNEELEDGNESYHIIGDKSLFVSKSSVQKFKNELKDFGDPLLIDKTKYLKPGYDFEFNEDGSKIFIDIIKEKFVWGDNTQEQPKNGKDKLKEKLKFFQDQRTGKYSKEMNDERKKIDKVLFKKYSVVKSIVKDFPITKPSDLIENPEKHKGEVQILSSGLIKITQNESIDKVIRKYYKEMSDMLGFEVLTEEELKKIVPQPQEQPPQQESIPEPINLNSYVDSDTESDSDVEDVET